MATSNSANSAKNMTWHKLLLSYGGQFLKWLNDSRAEVRALDLLANQLADFIIGRIETMRREWSRAPVEFWRQIPVVLQCCNQPEIFEQPFATEAYAYVHLLERYRRTWASLKYLTYVGVLPLGARGVKALDIGTGPAPALYAIADFYQILTEFAELSNIPQLRVPAPELDCIERSQSMLMFSHHFWEFCKRSGPFGPAFNDFTGLDLEAVRRWHQCKNEYVEWWDSETGQYEEIYSPFTASAFANSLFRYRLLVFSNFLTLESDVEKYTPELRDLFSDLNPGAVVIVLGSTGDSYQKIYEQVATIAREARLLEAGWHTDELGPIEPQKEAARIIKLAQNRVYRWLEGLVGSEKLAKGKEWPDYWNPEPSPKSRPQFALRIFRRGRWPIRLVNSTRLNVNVRLKGQKNQKPSLC
jgi:hypothetical protein